MRYNVLKESGFYEENNLMNNEGYNTIGIDGNLDWKRIRKLFIIGLIAGVMVFIGDWLFGYGVADETLTGNERMLSAYLGLSDTRIFWSAFLGLIGIPLEGLCFFGIYRLMAERAPRLAHSFRSGVFGYLIFGACGVHVPCLAAVYVYNHLMEVSPEKAIELSMRFGTYFLLPAMIMFMIFSVIMWIAQIKAFATGKTPYPRWCWIFSLPVGMAVAAFLNIFGNHAVINALTAAWISIGNIWQFAGLILFMRRAQSGESASD